MVNKIFYFFVSCKNYNNFVDRGLVKISAGVNMGWNTKVNYLVRFVAESKGNHQQSAELRRSIAVNSALRRA